MAGSEENELDTSPCEDEVVVKEGRKRRAEVQEEDVDGNRSRAKTLFRHIGSAADELEIAACAILQEVEDSKYEELVAKQEAASESDSRHLRLSSSDSEVEPPSRNDEEASDAGVYENNFKGALESENEVEPAEVRGNSSSRSNVVGPEEQVVFAAPLLNRFPSIEGDEEDGEEQLQDGEEQFQGENENDRSVVHEEAGDCRQWLKVDEGWSRVSSEPDQVWYSERTSDTLVEGWRPAPRQLCCKRPEENED